MNQFFVESLTPLYRYLKRKEYREYFNLLSKYGNVKRFEKRDIKFLNYKFSVPDCPSFLDQYKTIFVDEIYKYESKKSNPVIYDCGANIGTSALYFKRLYPNAIIKAFEADPAIAKTLSSNLANNNINGIEVINKAVWVDNNGVSFGQEGGDGGSIFNDKNSTKIESIRLKDIIEKETEIDFLKMDIEGAEVAIMQDCKDVIKKVNFMFIEYHSFSNQKQDLDVVLEILTQNKFRYFIQTVSYNKHPFLKKNMEHDMDLQLNISAFKI